MYGWGGVQRCYTVVNEAEGVEVACAPATDLAPQKTARVDGYALDVGRGLWGVVNP